MPRGVARVTGRLAAPGRFVVAWWVTGGLGALDFSAAGESDCTHPGESLTRVIVWAKGDCYAITGTKKVVKTIKMVFFRETALPHKNSRVPSRNTDTVRYILVGKANGRHTE